MRRSILADGFWLASAASDMIRSYVGLYACCGDLEAICNRKLVIRRGTNCKTNVTAPDYDVREVAIQCKYPL